MGRLSNNNTEVDRDRAGAPASPVPYYDMRLVSLLLMRARYLPGTPRLFATGRLALRPPSHAPPAPPQGELAYRPISYTPWPVDASYEGERVRIAVGPVADRQLR